MMLYLSWPSIVRFRRPLALPSFPPSLTPTCPPPPPHQSPCTRLRSAVLALCVSRFGRIAHIRSAQAHLGSSPDCTRPREQSPAAGQSASIRPPPASNVSTETESTPPSSISRRLLTVSFSFAGPQQPPLHPCSRAANAIISQTRRLLTERGSG